MGADFKLDPDYEQGAYRTDEVRDLIEDAGARTEAVAKSLAPDDPATIGDDIVSSIYHDTFLTPAGWQGRVGVTDFKGGWYEFGTSRQPARPYLIPAVEQEVGPIEADTGQDTN